MVMLALFLFVIAHLFASARSIQDAKVQKVHVETLVYSGTDYIFPVLLN
jgi:hypothetical protein